MLHLESFIFQKMSWFTYKLFKGAVLLWEIGRDIILPTLNSLAAKGLNIGLEKTG